MKNITIRDILEFTRGHMEGDIDPDFRSQLLETPVTDIATDSRQVKEGSLFIAIPGENVDGHKFVPQVAAITKSILVEEDLDMIKAKSDVDALPENVAYIKVDNTVAALQRIGTAIRSKYDKPVIGVTGSVGKTTTREMITAAVASNIETFSTSGNMNSQIGVPVTVSGI